ncbi:MAG: hypothetical protein OEY09_01665 [Gammaproteobacteria bacterium]|nr:hypothetical protein [Gammaproteobacteria bacterium]
MKSSTLVIQSHRNPLPYQWLQACLDSVQQWAESNSYDYRFLSDDILFAAVPEALLEKTVNQKVIATDLGRLRLLQDGLESGYQTVVWCDGDFLIFNPDKFVLPDSDYALGREVWVQSDESGKLKSFSKVHNAFLMFRQGNHFLDFYADTAERLLWLNQGSMPPQFIGPKLLTALHNIAICPVMETAGMLSPLVMRDLLNGGGKALDLFHRKSPELIYGANLSGSLVGREGFGEVDMGRLIGVLFGWGVEGLRP